MSKRLLTVFGATGNQGGSVIDTILDHALLSEKFVLRGITRKPSSEKAKALSARGVEIIAADLNNPSEFQEALKGSYATKVSQGKAIADACVAAGVQHAVLSTLPHVTRLTDGRLKHVEHFDGKAAIAEYFKSVKGKTGIIATYFMPDFYTTNFKMMIRANPHINGNTPTLTLPWDAENNRVPLLVPGMDTGTFVAGIIGYHNPRELNGKYIQGVSERSTPSKVVKEISEAVGREIVFNSVPEDVFVDVFPQESAKELTENMILVRDCSYYGPGSEKKQGESDRILEPSGLKTQSLIEWAKSARPWIF